MVTLEWKRAAADVIVSGKYAVIREDILGERLYLAMHCGELLTVVEEADVAKQACATHRARGEK